ncbi:hypothetical protein ACIQFU_37140 [Streptomyces sp. NPDC093065]|uniref:hypothetical protein n=1 Tax=Streptomyces sp. NPDC093065 TaxID=3366021 RepID=UPI003801DD0A
MPRKQSTAAQRARQRQALTGEKYTAALRAETRPTLPHHMFSAAGAGWAPITQRAERELDEVWPDHPRPHWEEKFGDLCWKGTPWSQGPEVWAVINRAAREAAFTCQICPSLGRKRVVWVGEEWGGMPWVKTCCDACWYVPSWARTDREYLRLVAQYEEHG